MTTTMIRIRNFTIPACYCYRCCYFADDYAVDRYVSVARIGAGLVVRWLFSKARGMRDIAYGIEEKRRKRLAHPWGLSVELAVQTGEEKIRLDA